MYGVPKLPSTGPLIPEMRYNPRPAGSKMPTQEPGTRKARPLPFQPNSYLTGFASGVARLALSNVAPFVSRASHFAVYDNLAAAPALAQYPAAFPGQHTVAATATGPIQGTRYDPRPPPAGSCASSRPTTTANST